MGEIIKHTLARSAAETPFKAVLLGPEAIDGGFLLVVSVPFKEVSE